MAVCMQWTSCLTCTGGVDISGWVVDTACCKASLAGALLPDAALHCKSACQSCQTTHDLAEASILLQLSALQLWAKDWAGYASAYTVTRPTAFFHLDYAQRAYAHAVPHIVHLSCYRPWLQHVQDVRSKQQTPLRCAWKVKRYRHLSQQDCSGTVHYSIIQLGRSNNYYYYLIS